MKPMNTFACAALALAPLLGVARAGDDASTPLSRAPDYCALGTVVGAKVSMAPSPDAVAEATKEGDVAERPTGKIDDLLIDCCDGSLSWAVVTFDKTLGVGGKTVAIPVDQLGWNPKDECFDLHQTVEQLKALPKFDVDGAKGHGLDASCSDLVTLWPDSRVGAHVGAHRADARGPALCEPIEVDGKQCPAAKPQLRLASELQGATIYARGEKFGKVETCILDRANRSVRYLVVRHGGTLGVGTTDRLIPVLAVNLHQHEGEYIHSVNRSPKELENAVKYEKPEEGILDLAAAARANEMFATDIKRRTTTIRQ